MSSRKFESGSYKRKKKQRTEDLIRSQKGALDKFVIKDCDSVDVSNVDLDVNIDASNVDLDVNIDASNVDLDANLDANISDSNVDYIDSDANIDATNVDLDVNIDASNVSHANLDSNINSSNVDHVDLNANVDVPIDIFDPRNWNSLDSKVVDILVSKGPKRDLSIEYGPIDKFSKRFHASCYTRILSNGEKRDRDWLVYSKDVDGLFCFCCKIFNTKVGRSQLTNKGFCDWSHIGIRLKEHETSLEHVRNMTSWYDLRLRLKTNQTIDKVAQREIEKEKDHWRKVLLRIVSIVKFLAKHNLAFRGSNQKLYQSSNGNFLGLVEMLAEFDPITQEHVHRITNDEVHFHYLGSRIQNEIILLLASTIKFEIVRKIKQAKYFFGDS
ncbi:Zinc finger MYM-type protein 5 [Linum grandiflorum]